jgi:hypothetical protein
MIFAFSFPGILVWAAIQQISTDTPRLRRILTSGKEKGWTAYRVLKVFTCFLAREYRAF